MATPGPAACEAIALFEAAADGVRLVEVAMMFLRIAKGVRDHFEQRFIEWSMATVASYWGWTVAQQGIAWTNKAAWAGMLRFASEDAWGVLCMVAGGFWLLALAINGTFAGTFYARHSPKVRGLAALGSAFVWFQVTLSVSAVQTSGSGIYPLPLVLSVWCVFNAWRDIGRGGQHASHRRP